MMYELAHWLRAKMPWIWDTLVRLNGYVFAKRYGRKIRLIPGILAKNEGKYKIVPINILPPSEIEEFFSRQPEEAYEFFTPHGFDLYSIEKLQKDKTFLAYMVKDEETIVGYFFLRCFILANSFLGKMVDHQHRGQGIGRMMCLCGMDIAKTLGIRMYETISKDNPASIRASQDVLEMRVVKEMPGNYLMFEDLRRKENAA